MLLLYRLFDIFLECLGNSTTLENRNFLRGVGGCG